uniref:Related to Transcription factor SPT8 n=1 Tax=Melanopsichium pennsylvanicum 4 TaxID=1398559 RepID=A0A077RBT8_9BASI|nr:related to Transcription factor SPT8 [Melanopsichium pennsylvanicum 4]
MDDDIEMDDDHEHEPIEEPDYDEDDGDGDADEDDDDMDADDASADADDDDEDDGDGDADDASVAASRTGLARTPTRTTDDVLSSATYLRKVQQRRSLFRPSPASITTSTGYQIEPLAAAPHSSQIHAMALSLDGQTLLTGGSDGFVRKYNIHATMNGKTMLTQNVRHGFVEGITRGGNLTAFWPHEEHLPTSSSISSSSSSSSNSNAFSQSHLPDKDRLVGVIHSLAIQQDALWGLSGSESGNIHLCTIRHDPGSTRHVFRKHKGAVSALALTSDETTMISGGWDQSVHQWDLNTGKIVRSFDGFAGQISGLSFRPISHQRERSGVSVHASAAGNNDVEALEDQEDKARNEGRVGTPDRGEEDAEQEVSQVAKEDEEETFKSASADGTDQNKDADAKQADAPTLPLGDSHSSKIAENGSHANERSEKNGETSMSSEKSTADDNLKANDSTTLSELATDSTMSNNNDASSNVFSMSDKKATTPVPAVASSSSEKPVDSSASTSIKKEIDASGASSGVPGDDPTEEELAFEAELNASLGMSLDGSGMTKADGTRLDGVTANATGTTAGGLMVAGADEDDDDLFGGDTPPPSSGANDKEQGVGLKKENNASALEKASKSTSATATTTASGTATASGGAASSTGPPKKPLPKPAFGGFSIASSCTFFTFAE